MSAHRRRVCLWTHALALLTSGVGSHLSGQEPRSADSVPLLRLREEVRIGSVDDPSVGFTRVGSVEVGSDGLIYVSDTRDRELRVYRADGSYLRTYGGIGQGPGEFQALTRFGIRGDTLWAWDGIARRLTLLDRHDGRVLATARLERAVVQVGAGRAFLVDPLTLDDEGFILSALGPYEAARPITEPLSNPTVTTWPRVRFSLDGRIADTVGPAPVDYRAADRRVIYTADGSIEIEASPPRSSEAHEMVFFRRDLSGALLSRQVLRYRPVSHAEAEIDATPRAPTAAGRGAGAPDEYQAPIGVNWNVGLDGYLWIPRERLSGRWRWLLLDPDGAPVGELRPDIRGFRIEWSAGLVIWAVESDEFGVPWVVRYRAMR